jgi:hypothetical protein
MIKTNKKDTSYTPYMYKPFKEKSSFKELEEEEEKTSDQTNKIMTKNSDRLTDKPFARFFSNIKS